MIRFHDTPSRGKRSFEPLEPGRVRTYSCGPTVWDYSHIGNFRSFLFYDVLKRYLTYRWFEVEHVVNLTDIAAGVMVTDTPDGPLWTRKRP